MRQLQDYLKAPVKSWTGTVWAGRGQKGLWYEGRKNVVPKVPALPEWGLVGLGVLLLTGGAIIFGRRRLSATRGA